MTLEDHVGVTVALMYTVMMSTSCLDILESSGCAFKSQSGWSTPSTAFHPGDGHHVPRILQVAWGSALLSLYRFSHVSDYIFKV